MKTKIFSFFGITLLGITVSAQILLSKIPGNPNPNALLDLKDPAKGVIFTKATDILSFPLFNISVEDRFNDLPALEGSILYNKTDKQYYKYDGTTWIPALQLGGFFNPFETRKQSSSSVTWSCLLGSCDIAQILLGFNNKQTIPLSGIDNRAQLLVNNLNLPVGANYLTIPNAGLYYISGVVGFSGASLGTTGNISYWINLDVSYDNGTTWTTLAFKQTLQNGGAFIDVGQTGNKSASVSSTVTLPANARIRLVAAISSTTLIGGYSSSTNHADTFVNIQRLK